MATIAPQHYEKPVSTDRGLFYDFGSALEAGEFINSIQSLTEIGSSDFAGELAAIGGGFNLSRMVVNERTAGIAQVAKFRVGPGGTAGQLYDIRILALTSFDNVIEGHALFTAVA